jgi:outer membrane biosynthesis protein TonB
MSGTGSQRNSLRPTIQPMVVALLLSIATHALIFGVLIVLGVAAAVYDAARHNTVAELKKVQELHPVRQQPQQEVELVFVDVDPSQAAKEAPKDAKYYSAVNSKAANLDSKLDTDTPKITGNQTHVPQTETAPRSKAMPLQPSPPPEPKPPVEEKAEAHPKGGQKPGDLAMAKPTPKPAETKTTEESEDPSVETHKRPRTLAEARKQNHLPSEPIKQDGGVKAHLSPAFSVQASPWGAYDKALVDAISGRWYDLLENQDFARGRTGKVIIEFRLNYDGRILQMRVIENDVDEILSLLCQKAIQDPAPFAPWPNDMRRMMGADYRDVRFTFFYE